MLVYFSNYCYYIFISVKYYCCGLIPTHGTKYTNYIFDTERMTDDAPF